MTAAVELFTYAESVNIRVIPDANGEPLFIASDVADALGYRMASDMTRRLDDEDRDTRSVRTPGGVQNVTVITEPGLYDAVLGSRVPDARDFRRWVVRVVLPQIRKTGGYSTQAAIPQTYPEALRLAADEHERAELEAAARVAAEARAAELEAPASAWNELAEAAGDYSVADAAKVLSRDPNISTGERRLFQEMHAKLWIYRRDGRWRAYQAQVDNGRLVEKLNRPYVNGVGETVTPAPTIRVTPKGIAALQKILGGSGQLALMEAVS